MSRLIPAIMALLIICSASSCNIWRKVTGRRKAAPAVDTTALIVKPGSARAGTAPDKQDMGMAIPAPAIAAQKQALLQSYLPLWNAQTAYSTFSGKAKVHYEGKGDNQDFTAVIRMEKDRKIWISITALGLFEAARALITPDTIIAIDRIHKEVRVLPFAEADKLLPVSVDFSTLQRLLIGDVLQIGRGWTDVIDTTQRLVLAVSDSAFLQQVTFGRADGATIIITQALSSASSVLYSFYKDYDVIDGRRFAKGRELTMKDKGETYHINLEFSKASFDEPVDMSFSIPAKYERK